MAFKICNICQHRCELPKLMKEVKVAVEVGVLHANYSEVLLHKWSGFLHLVDPWVAYPAYTDKHQDHEYNFNEAMKRLKPFEDRIKVHREFNSDNVANKIGTVGLAYLDGNHKFEYVISDLRIWWNHLKPGGILAGHDLFHMEWPDVTAAVVLFAKEVDREVFIIPGKVDCPCGEGGIPSFYLVR